MALVAYRAFRGEIPRAEPHLLPSGAAQEAHNCIFTAGVPQSTRDGLYLKDLASSPVKGIYTEDGINFYSWPSETRAFRSPIKSDVHNRMYFLTLDEGVLKVSSRLNMTPDGPAPMAANTFRVGVPTPTAEPKLTLVDRNQIPMHPAAQVQITAWWDDAGKRYGESVVSHTELSKFKEYRFAQPDKPEDTPVHAVLKCLVEIAEAGKAVAQALLGVGAVVKSTTFPGMQEYALKAGPNANLWDVTIAWGVYATASYQFTVLNDWKEESGPSPAATIRPTYLQDVKVEVTPPAFTGFKPMSEVKVYRTYGTTAAFVEVEVRKEGDAYFDDTREASAVGLALTTAEYEPPPTGLQGIEVSPNGIFAMFVDNQLYLTEPYRPHAASYIYTFSHSIRGVQAGQQAFTVTTADGLYLLAGASPGAMQAIKLPQPQPGIAQRSMVDVDGGALYASGDGLVHVSGTATSMEMTQTLFGREKWRTLFGDLVRDASLRLSYHDGHVVASSDRHDKGFILRIDETVASLSRHTQRMESTFWLPVEDALYYSVGRSVYQFQAGTELPFYWKGREEIFAYAEVFGAGFLRASGPVQLQIWCDDRLVYDQLVQPGYFRLPGTMPRCMRLCVAMAGTGKVQELCLARSMMELRNG